MRLESKIKKDKVVYRQWETGCCPYAVVDHVTAW